MSHPSKIEDHEVVECRECGASTGEACRGTLAGRSHVPRRSAVAYAAKFYAETVGYEPPVHVEPTDAALLEAFKHGARIPSATQLSYIRRAFYAWASLREPETKAAA